MICSDNHIIADHSYDHMYHNSFNTPNNAYMNVQDDSKYFGVMNIYPGMSKYYSGEVCE